MYVLEMWASKQANSTDITETLDFLILQVFESCFVV